MGRETGIQPATLAMLLYDTCRQTPKLREVHIYIIITSFAKASFLFTPDGYCIEEAQEYPDIDSGNGDIQYKFQAQAGWPVHSVEGRGRNQPKLLGV